MNTILFETEANKRASDARLAKSKKQVVDYMVILVEELESLNEELLRIKALQQMNAMCVLSGSESAPTEEVESLNKQEQDIRMEITNKKNYLIVLIESQAQ